MGGEEEEMADKAGDADGVPRPLRDACSSPHHPYTQSFSESREHRAVCTACPCNLHRMPMQLAPRAHATCAI